MREICLKEVSDRVKEPDVPLEEDVTLKSGFVEKKEVKDESTTVSEPVPTDKR